MSNDLKVGQHVSFLRSHNKAVSLTGTIAKVYDDAPVVDVKLDDHDPEWIETAHVDDVTILDAAPAGAASVTTVNGVPV